MGISVYRIVDNAIEERRNINSVDLGPYLNDGWSTEMPFLDPAKELPLAIPAEPIVKSVLESHELKPPDCPALSLINSATTTNDLRVLPSIGDAAAKIILEERPEDGYGSLQDLPQRIFEGRFKTDLDAIQGWVPVLP